ncbi:MAG: LAGLIDADG family homing endonuclease, partial [Methanosarcinales archaeon]
MKAPGNLLKINLDNGKMHEIVVTPEHPFFVLLDGNIVKIRADQLQKGFAVVIPNKLNINPTRNIDLKKEILDKLDDRFYIFDKNLGYKIKKHLTDRYGTLENAHMKLNLNINYSFFTHILKKGKFPFSIIKKYPKLLLKIDKLRLKTKEGKKWIEFPTEMNEELAEFLGFVIGEGNIDKNSIHITNKEKTITKRVRYLSNKLFGINAIETQDKRNKVRRISLGSKALVFLFNLIFDIPIGKKNDKVKIPTQILKSPNSVLKSFIRAYFDGEGYVGENSREMEITSASKDLISTLGMALLRFGILSSYSSRKIGDNYYYRLFIRGRFAEIYAEKISSIVDSKLARLKKLKAIGEHQTPGKQEIILLGSLLKEIRELYGVPIGYIQNFVNSYGCFEKKGAISRKSLIKFLDALEASKKSWYWILKSSSKGVIYEKLQNRFRNRGWLNATLNRLEELNWIEKRVNPHKIFVLTEKGKEKLEQIENFDHLIYETVKKIANSNLSWIKIKNISTVKSSSKFVYDLTVNDFHNFVANGMIVHNTTSIAKLARHFQKQGLRPALLALDYHRPAAIDQLVQLGKQINVPVYFDRDNDPYKGAKDGIEKFKNFDAILIDTSGRNALDSKLAEELKKLGEIIKPDEVLLTIPADIGKVAKSQSEEFNKLVGITGVFVTKLDGTAKGGGCLSACAATGAKVKFIGTGEKIEDLEVYNPERFVSRLLGLGDLQTLLEKAKEAEIKPEKIEKIVEGKFTLQEFYEQIEAMGKMGSLEKVASMIPGFGMLKLPKDLMEKQEKKLKKFKVIIQSLTPEERETPKIINSSRIRRCAKGAGVSESD